MSPRAALVALALGLSASACSTAEPETPRDQASASDFIPVGGRSAFTVSARCGVEFVTINGDSWRTRRRDDGDFGAPDGWPEDIRGTLTRQSETRAVFVSDEIPEVLVFRPAPNALYICG